MTDSPLRQNAAKNHPEKLSQLQPGLRSYIIYNDIPPGCIAFELPDDSCLPHFRAGEVAIIDSADRAPMHGELFLLQYRSGKDQIIRETTRQGINGSAVWWIHPSNRPRSHEDRLRRMRCGLATITSDGPYADSDDHAGYVESLLKGRVVGLLEMDFRKRLH